MTPGSALGTRRLSRTASTAPHVRRRPRTVLHCRDTGAGRSDRAGVDLRCGDNLPMRQANDKSRVQARLTLDEGAQSDQTIPFRREDQQWRPCEP